MSDYVISRKRSRHSGAYAVDPCLGYYVLQSHNSLAKSLNHFQGQHSSGRIENSNEHNAASVYDNCTMPSSLSEELELESPSTERYLNLDPENTALLEATDWVELVPSHAKPVPGLFTAESIASAASGQNISQNTDVLTEEPPPITVEEFLKWSNHFKSKAGKTYRVRNTRLLKARTIKTAEPTKIGDNDQYDDGHKVDALELRSRNIPRASLSKDDPCDIGSSSPEHESSSICDTPKITRSGNVKRKRRKLSKPLKARIYEAALSTHADPEDDFAQDEVDPTRPPLRFVPGPTKNALRKRKTRNWILVDPRKSKSLCTASFASNLQRASRQVLNDGLSSLSHTLARLPMKNWKWGVGQGLPPPSIPNPRSSIKIINHKALQNQPIASAIPHYPPLMFVPLNGADSDYTALFRRKREMTDNDKKATLKKRKQEPHCPPSLQFTPSTNQPTKSDPSLKRSKETSSKPPMRTMLPIPRLTTPTRSRSLSSPVLRDVNYSSTPCGDVIQESKYLSTSIEHTLSARTPIVIESSATTSSILPFPAQQTTMSRNHSSVLDTQQHIEGLATFNKRPLLSNKPLRPLESFMDEFLENIRNVHEQMLEGKAKDKHPRPSKITSKSPRSQCVGRDSVPSTLLSKTITSGAIKSGTPPENSLSFDNQLLGWSTPNATETLGRYSSPDILSLLEPRNYQVVLGSR